MNNFEKKVADVIKSFAEIGIQLERGTIQYSFGDYNECEELFYTALRMCDHTITEIEKIPEHKEIIEWMQQTEGKGLFFAGSCGRGKTSILTGVIPIIFKLKFNKIVTPISANDIVMDKNYLKSWSFCVDDVGIEPINNHYGEKRELFADIMNAAESRLCPVFASTNLSGIDMIGRYGKRTVDRIIRLCKIVKFEGESFR